MKKVSGLLITILLLACSPEGDRLKPLAAGSVVLAFGDSLTFGTGVTPGESYPAVLASLINRKVINAGVPGEVTSTGLLRLPGLLDQNRPALLILIHGGNDMLRRHSQSETRDNLTAMINEARNRQIDVVMLAVPKPGIILSAAALYEQVATETGTPIDLDAIPDILQYPTNKSDPIHPNSTGYSLMAERLRDLLRENGALPDQ